MKYRLIYGVTLVEVMIVITILAIVMTLGVSLAGSNKPVIEAKDTAKKLQQTLDYARTKAVLNGEIISICPLTENNQCGKDWARGWLVFRNPQQSAQPTPQQILRIMQGIPEHYLLELRAFADQQLLSFFPGGYTGYQNGSFYYKSKLANISWTLILNRAGRSRLSNQLH